MLNEAMQQVPALAVLVFVLIAFLKHMDKVNARHQLMVEHWHKVQREATEVNRRCAEALGENSNVLREVSVLLRKMNGGGSQ